MLLSGGQSSTRGRHEFGGLRIARVHGLCSASYFTLRTASVGTFFARCRPLRASSARAHVHVEDERALVSGVSFCASYVKSIPPNAEKWLRKRYDENDDNNMSNETKRETNYSMNNK